jgi:phage baseplate assembly protein W
MESNAAFLGRGWSFPPEFFSGGAGVVMVSGETDVQQSLCILLGTSLLERVMFPGYGSDIWSYIFEEMGQALVNALEGSISDAILNNEPRVKTEGVRVNVDNVDPGKLWVSIEYTILATNNRYNMVYPFYINEATR